jgi:hypothetical protein
MGQIEENGTLTIIDRVKNLVGWMKTPTQNRWLITQIKLQNGEYLALDKTESVYKACGKLDAVCQFHMTDRRRHHDALPRRTALCRSSGCRRLSCMFQMVNTANPSTKGTSDIT